MSDLAVKVSEPIALKARLNEDWLAVAIGLLVFGLALVSVTGTDLLGWAVTTSVYTDVTQALNPFPKAYASPRGGGGPVEPFFVAAFAWCGRHRRGVPDLLGGDLLHLAQMVRFQPRVVGAAGLRHLDLRRGGGDRNRRSDQGSAGSADPGVVAGRRVRRR